MALPKWITPAGQLGIVPELEYYEFPLDAYDASGGLLVFSRVSGRLPLGLQVVSPTEYTITTNGNITAYTGSYVSQYSSGANAVVVLDDTVNGTEVTVRYVNEIEFDTAGNLTVNGANVTVKPTSVTQPRPARIQGIPVSEQGSDQNVVYTFTIRVRNTWTDQIADRTFNLTITNVAPPIITPKNINRSTKLNVINPFSANLGDYITQTVSGANALVTANVVNSTVFPITYVALSPEFRLGSGNLTVVSGNVLAYPTQTVNSYPLSTTVTSRLDVRDLGIILDGSELSLQLEAVEFLPGAVLTWSVTSGELPPGLSLSQDGLISGYLEPIPSLEAGTIPNWDMTAWSFGGWDFPLNAIAKRFTFGIQVTDGVNSDLAIYSIEVYPRSNLTADNDELLISLTTLGTGLPLTIDYGNKHNPILLTTQNELVPVRESSYFSFEFEAIDLDGEALRYRVPALITGSFDEQTFSNVLLSYPYVTETIQSGILSSGIFPSTLVAEDSAAKTSSTTIDYTAGEFLPGDTVKLLNNNNFWQLATIGTTAIVRITSNVKINAGVGNYLTQDSSLANAQVSNVGTTTGTLVLGGNILTGNINTIRQTYVLTFNGNIRANVGDYITQSLSGANARVTSAVGNTTVGSGTANVLMINGAFTNGTGNIAIRGIAVPGRWPTANVKDTQNTTLSANIGDIITQVGTTGNAVVLANIRDAISIPVRYEGGTFTALAGNVQINGINANVWITDFTSAPTVSAITVTAGDIIQQPSTGANAVAIQSVINGTVIPVQFISNNFTTGTGNITLAGANISAFVGQTVANTVLTVSYTGVNTFDFNSTLDNAGLKINGTAIYGNLTTLLGVSASYGALSTEGTVGFDEARFDQGTLSLPAGLSLNQDSGWITGQIPGQTIAEVTYEFELQAYKRDDETYQDSQIYRLTVLGDLNNRIDWVTDPDLGIITTGKISDLSVLATSPLGKTVFYELSDDSYHRLPQGLTLTLGGLISGRVSFEVFGLDSGLTTIDGGSTTFDFTCTFTVTARDISNTVSANRTFTLRLRQFNRVPYENLYITALPSADQRRAFEDIVNDRSIFPVDKLYRLEDPWFGLAQNIRSLFLAGLSPSTLAEYIQASQTNHFVKRFLFNGIKTAQVLDSNFDVKYEVVYLQLDSENDIESTTFIHNDELGPADTLELAGTIDNPYYDSEGNSYTTAYPNSTQNMESKIISQIGYENRGALPDWMTSRQADGRQLGFVHAVVLAYTKPGESELIAYRLRERNFNFNTIDFTIDRYELDNIYSENYDIVANAYVTSRETTFDRYPPLAGTLDYVATVDYALTTPYDQIHLHTVEDIRSNGGLDGIRSFKDGDTLVFGIQEFRINQNTAPDYNDGWSDVLEQWDRDPWAQGTSIDAVDYGDSVAVEADDDVQVPYDPTLVPPNTPTSPYGAIGYDFTPGERWDGAQYVSGFNENLLNPAIPNKRIGVWQVNISEAGVVTLTYIQAVNYYDAIYVRNGFTYGGTNLYYDPVVKQGNNIANYSVVPQTLRTTYTTFDGNGTRFFDNRDSYNVPRQGDKYIKFTSTGVFT